MSRSPSYSISKRGRNPRPLKVSTSVFFPLSHSIFVFLVPTIRLPSASSCACVSAAWFLLDVSRVVGFSFLVRPLDLYSPECLLGCIAGLRSPILRRFCRPSILFVWVATAYPSSCFSLHCSPPSFRFLRVSFPPCHFPLLVLGRSMVLLVAVLFGEERVLSVLLLLPDSSWMCRVFVCCAGVLDCLDLCPDPLLRLPLRELARKGLRVSSSQLWAFAHDSPFLGKQLRHAV